MFDSSLIAAAIIFAWALTGLVVRGRSKTHHLEQPNSRSMHVTPTPAGGGIAIIAAVALLWPLWTAPLASAHVMLVLLAVGLAVVSWIDDIRHLWPVTRIVAQAAVVAVALALVPVDWRIAPSLPLALERVLLGVAWVWLINLTNFMDGIDGIAASEAIAVALGYVALATTVGLDKALVSLALIIAGASTGYLVWNWPPARIFMGDVGSIPLGFLLGWLMLDLALHGHVAAAIILPMYFLADATITLVRRVLAGEAPWEPHRSHFYQRAVQGGAKQDAVVMRMSVANAALILLALLSVRSPALAIAAAAVVTGVLLLSLSQSARGASRLKRAVAQ